ncbi:extracellular matrix organizing protein FRAS1-like [Oncorhynchus tshawytscha]|uniref:extracellular matrix organizing protein FRAS1-like n=1 Tax=Oncorhynchus tshawytscha TaxID=74940 RepID=UPI001C3CCD3F|nr:extracellular matrix organizing protein FRAS1-like [Oncorhynchus tshawytscha]
MSCMHAVNMGIGWIFVAALAGILTSTPGIQGACVYQGSLFANNTLWRPDSCQECQCFSDITVCQLATCLNPHCDYQKGERLRIPPNQCCPECLPSSQGSCQHDEAVYGHDSQWSAPQCQVCVCSGGSVSCRQRPCPPLSCPPDQIAFTPAGDCCPKCVRSGASCSWDDHEYRDGEEWRPSPCSKCVCSNGRPQCFTAECQPVACTQHESLVIQPGQCCPQCLPTSCLSAGREHKHGEQWQKSSCTRCVCDRGQSRCHTHTCPPRTCEEGQTKVKRAGQCCDDCVAAKGSCLYELTVRYHGDMWNGTDCEFCTCERGQVLCQRAQCGRVECPTGSELVHLPGKCCPECQSMKTSCVYPDPDLSSGKPQRPLANQERWNEGPCRECECREGRVTCYLMSCPTCPLGTLAVPHQGTCCPECKQVQCQSDCLSCSGTPDHCESCKDSTSLLLDGRCVSTCPRGYYADGKVCAACQSSCATCENDFECSSCGGSLLLNNRHCVATCDLGSYQDPTQCLRCHASCSVCVGPSQQECVLCSDPSHLLREGLCVPDCGSGFYIQQGTCYACDSSCITCYPDNPKCMSCPPGSVMHHGKCISHCPDQHYLDSHGHCRACHSSCWSCSGSAVSQCSLCTQGLSFHQGQCLEACGQGLYHQDGTCLNCHPSCRTCVGPLSSDCLRCLKPEQALQPRTSPPHTPLPHGVCVAQCPAPFYLDTQHTCRECHTSCLQCTGGSSQNCTSCSPPYVLQEGQCVSRCPPGHTVQDNTCQGCHPSCQECSGTSQADCVSCSPLANFNNGYCRTSCPDGLFLHPQGFCQECSSNCQRCVADLQTGMGSVCLWCKIARTLLLGDHCVTHCPQGHYPWHGACKRCHVSCEGCSGEWPLSCTSCPSPSVLLTSGLCGPACPLGYYADRDRRCRACDGQCLSCELSGVCTACRDPGKVLLFGECRYDSCAYQYYLNTTTRTCRVCLSRYITSFETGNQPVTDIFHFIVYDGENNRLDNQMCTITITSKGTQPPVVAVRSGIKVQGGGRVQLSTNHIDVSDLDTPNEDLLVWMISTPKYGFIENTIGRVGLMGGSNTLIISPEVPFSVDDLTTDHIFYVQNVQNTEHHYQDTFSFYISDGSSQTEAFNVQIDIQSKEEKVPVVSVNRVRVEGNSGVVITNSSLNVLDQDTPDNDIIITVAKPPTYGKLRRRQFYSQPLENGLVLSQGSTFTYQDVLDLLLVYTPDVASGGSDELAFSLTDGIHTSAGRLTFTVDVRKTEGPRMTGNRGLQLAAGEASKITEQNLKGSDSDSDSLKLRYILIKDPPVGRLQLSEGGGQDAVAVKGPVKSFTQEEVNKGSPVPMFPIYPCPHVPHLPPSPCSPSPPSRCSPVPMFPCPPEDHLPPSVVVNKGLVLDENSVKKLTTLQLSATDQDSEPGELLYRITKQTALGHLEHARTPGSRITSFSQADLASRSIQYVHTSEEEKHTDEFSFIVSDGANEVAQTFYITIRPVDDSLPLLVVPGMKVQEGVRKTITEFELKATDPDTEEESITFTVVQAPRHGTMEWTNNGQHYRQTNSFTMDDVYQNRISYNHDGSNSLKDRFTFTVADGTNVFFMVEEAGKEVLTAAPQMFKIDILPVNDGTPRIVINLGLQWLEYTDNKATNLISKKELLTIDPDTDDGQLVYEVTAEPKHGFLQSKLKPGAPITTFTQADINLGLIRYVLFEESVTETVDNFKFLVKDGKPNVVSDNLFHIQWSLVSFQHRSYNVSEKAGTVSVTVKRTGNLNQYAIVLCRTEQGTATSSVGSLPGQHDYVEYAGQVQFDEREDTKVCTVEIQDDKVFEGVESFQMELSMPVYALLGQVTRASVNINDTEDGPTLQFDKKTYHVNESTGFIHAPIERKGDTSSTVSALCYTVPKSAKGSSPHGLESESDYKSRGMTGDSRVIFGPGVSVSTCDVKLIDDSEYELSEEFELHLSDASDNVRMGDVSVATVVIDGPNDASTVSLGNATFTFTEDAGTIEIPVMRQGSDLSSVTSVWCATRPSDPPSATPGVDYIPSSRRVEFKAGKTVETCSLTIMDDIQNPAMEGAESFVVFLSSPQGAVLLEPFQASVFITDTLDLPSMQFEKTAYKVTEKEGVLDIPVVRTGDLTVKSSVRCFTRTMSAMVMDDFEERRNADDSRIAFLQGEKVKNCTVHINDDSVFEPEEEFQVHLGTPLGDQWSGAMVGVSDVVTVTITNDEDAPTIEFEQASYQVREPPGPNGIEVLHIKVVRTGDQDRTSKVRCSTRDGSAQSGVDYNPKSRVLKFTPGMDHILFNVEILSNEDREWHESFSLVLGPDDPVEAVLGEITTATVTILDQEAVGSLILPATPIVVSLSDYDNVAEVSREGSKKQPSPGYPLVCVTPCDPHYPKYSVMRERCGEAGINQTSVHFSWEVAAPTDTNGARSPFETVTDTTPYTGVNHMVLDSIYFSRRFHVRCVAQARDKSGHLGTPLRSNIATVSTECSICHTPVTTGTARGFQAQSFIATLKYLDVKHKRHPNRIHISVQIPHQDGMLPLVSSMPLHNLHFLLSESIYRQQHVCSNLVTLKDLQGVSETGFLDGVQYDSISLGPGYDRPYQFNPGVREAQSIQLYKHLNMRSCIWTFDAYYDMTELIDVCGGSVTADFQARDSAQSFLTVQVPLYVSYIYVTAPRGWASLEHHTEMEFSFFYDTVLWRTGIQTDSVLSAGLQIIRIYIREDGRLVIEFKTHAKFRGQFVQEHHTLPGHKSHLMVPDHLGGIEFDMQLIWSAQSFDSPYQLWKATSSYSRKDYSGEYTVFLIPCTVQPTQSWTDPGDKPLSCTAHAPEKFQLPIAFQQTNRPVPVVYSLNTEFQLCNNEKVFMMDPAISDISMAEMDYKGAFSMGQTLYGRVLWNPEQNLNSAFKLQLEKVYLCTGRDGYVPFFDPTATLYNEGPQYGCIQTNKHLKHRFLILDRKQPEVCDRFFHDVPFEANFASDITELQTMTAMPGVDGFTMKVDALYKVEAGHQWYLQVIYVIGPESISGPRIQRYLTHQLAHSSDMVRARRDLTNQLRQSIAYSRARRDLVDQSGHLTLDESLIYDNEGDQTKNGTNMKILRLEVPVASTFNPQMGGSTGGGVAALTLLVLVLLGSFLLFRKCRRSAGKKPSKMAEEYPLNTKVEVYLERTLEKNFSSKHCTVRNINRNHDSVNSKVNGGAKVNGAAKVKQVNLEVKLHNNLGNDGTEV